MEDRAFAPEIGPIVGIVENKVQCFHCDLEELAPGMVDRIQMPEAAVAACDRHEAELEVLLEDMARNSKDRSDAVGHIPHAACFAADRDVGLVVGVGIAGEPLARMEVVARMAAHSTDHLHVAHTHMLGLAGALAHASVDAEDVGQTGCMLALQAVPGSHIGDTHYASQMVAEDANHTGPE